jgi:hypothetical protein
MSPPLKELSFFFMKIISHVSNGNLNLVNDNKQSHVVDLIHIDYVDGNLVIGCFHAQSIQEWLRPFSKLSGFERNKIKE